MKKFFSFLLAVIILSVISASISVFAAGSDPFVYTDTDSGVSFTVPAGWIQEDLSKEREIIKAKFCTENNTSLFIFGSADIWAQLSASDKASYTRADWNSTMFSKSDIAELFGTTADKISIVYYNNARFFQHEGSLSSQVYGIDIDVPATTLWSFDNGWMYMFQYTGTSYSDFENLIRSVRYPSAPDAELKTESDTDPHMATGNQSLIARITIYFLILILIVVAVIVYFPKNKAKPKSSVTCENCGNSLPPDNVFCHLCGAKIHKEESSE